MEQTIFSRKAVGAMVAEIAANSTSFEGDAEGIKRPVTYFATNLRYIGALEFAPYEQGLLTLDWRNRADLGIAFNVITVAGALEFLQTILPRGEEREAALQMLREGQDICIMIR